MKQVAIGELLYQRPLGYPGDGEMQLVLALMRKRPLLDDGRYVTQDMRLRMVIWWCGHHLRNPRPRC